MTKQLQGLSADEVKKSLETHGDNSLSKEKSKSFFKRFLENLSDPIIRILLIALGLQLILSFGDVNYFELGGILAAIILSTTVSTASEYRSEKAFDKLQEDLNTTVSVLREGVIKNIPVSELVVGDIVYLSVGEKIHADGEIISGRIMVDQSALNGESAECVKQSGRESGWDLTNETKAFRGSVITDGNAIMRVGRVGASTYYGMVAKDVQTETRVSPLKLRLFTLASQISKIGYVVAAVVGVTFLFNSVFLDNGFDSQKILTFLSNPSSILGALLDAFTLMITVVVVAAPEGLPMMITVVLSANMKRMLKDNILVKKLVGIETAGSMNILFTDKTGTITMGRPQVERFITVSGELKGIGALRKNREIFELLKLCARYNTDVVKSGEELTGGNATDRAVFEFFETEETAACSIIAKTPFTSERKYSSVTLKNGKTIIKGAAEYILTASRYAINDRGESVRFDKDVIYARYLEAVNHGHRVVGVAVGDKEKLEDLTLVALIVMKDKIRPEVYKSVEEVNAAGIQIVMITGDGKETASSIATECGILNRNAGHIVLSSDQMHEMTDAQLKELLPKLRVVSRALPQDKTRLVRLSQEMGLVVGMTGDGINDAPSLKLADIGFAMGGGADIAKSASDIVILDNSFLAISRTILYGRTIFKSIRKFITFQLTMNLVACGVSLIGQFIGVDTPITIIQMLWVNIIMDTLGGLAFAGEAPLPYYMRERPKSREEKILSREMLNQIFITGAYTLCLCITFLTSPVIRQMYGSMSPTPEFYTAFYALFIFAGIFNCLNARSSRLWLLSNIQKNKPFILIMLLISAIQIGMIYFGGELFRCTPLIPKELSFVVLLALTVIPFEMIRRLFYKLK